MPFHILQKTLHDNIMHIHNSVLWD